MGENVRIGVFCSGGDAPGMNACVRSVVRTAISRGHEVVGILRGYEGLLKEQFFHPAGTSPAPAGKELAPAMTARCVSDWSRRGGAFLFSSRSEAFRAVEGQKAAAKILKKHRVDALIPIGGDGTLSGAIALAEHWDGQIVGCPGTIDNDLRGTDYTIGFDTAVQTAVEAVDKIRDTAASHDRMFLIEVMGRHCGYIAAYTAISCGAEVVAIPETLTDFKRIVQRLEHLKGSGKTSILMVVAEGDEKGGAEAINAQLIDAGCPFRTRVVILGHLQRGGSPSPADRLRATVIGQAAVDSLLNGGDGVMIGTDGETTIATAFADAVAGHREIPQPWLTLLDETGT